MERYYGLSRYFTNTYGEKIGKLSLDAGFSCPNRDGSLSERGCIFCSQAGSGEFTFGRFSLKEQIGLQKERQKKKWKNKKYFAYLQNFTNTYAPLSRLRSVYKEVLEDPDIIGLAIATRGDCLGEDVLDLLEEIQREKDLWIEIGMQSTKASTIKAINRGYSHKLLEDRCKELRRRSIPFLLHIIFGLPGEQPKDMMDSIEFLNQSGAFGVKIHSLYIQKDSHLYRKYIEEEFPLLSKDSYTDLVVEAIGRMNSSIVIHRITGDGDKDKLIAPKWSADKLSVIGEINHKLKLRGICQGSLLKEEKNEEKK